MKHILLIAALISAPICTKQALAQEATSAKPVAASAPENKRFYRLDFIIKQMEGGRTINSRSYSIVLQGGNRRTSVRAGTSMPVKTSATDIQQLQIGANIDCFDVVEVEGQLTFHIKVELSSVAAAAENSSSNFPALRQNVWDSYVVVPLRKTTSIFSSDDLASKQTMQLEVLTTPIK